MNKEQKTNQTIEGEWRSANDLSPRSQAGPVRERVIFVDRERIVERPVYVERPVHPEALARQEAHKAGVRLTAYILIGLGALGSLSIFITSCGSH